MLALLAGHVPALHIVVDLLVHLPAVALHVVQYRLCPILVTVNVPELQVLLANADSKGLVLVLLGHCGAEQLVHLATLLVLDSLAEGVIGTTPTEGTIGAALAEETIGAAPDEETIGAASTEGAIALPSGDWVSFLPGGDFLALLLDLPNLGHSLGHVQGGLDVPPRADPVHLIVLLGQQLHAGDLGHVLALLAGHVHSTLRWNSSYTCLVTGWHCLEVTSSHSS